MIRTLIAMITGVQVRNLHDTPLSTIHMLAGLGIHGQVNWESFKNIKTREHLEPCTTEPVEHLKSELQLAEVRAEGVSLLRQDSRQVFERLRSITHEEILGTATSYSTHSHTQATWEMLRSQIASQAWQLLLIEDQSLEALLEESNREGSSLHLEAEASRYTDLDQNLVNTLDQLDNQTAVLILFPPRVQSKPNEGHQEHGFFVLVDPAQRLHQPSSIIELSDLIHTTFALGGFDSQALGSGQNLLATGSNLPDLSDEQEEILRERLSGLGYLG